MFTLLVSLENVPIVIEMVAGADADAAKFLCRCSSRRDQCAAAFTAVPALPAHKHIPALNRSCPACPYKCINPGLPAGQFDSLDSDEESTDPVEDEHHVIFDCPSYTYARQLFSDISGSNNVSVSQFLNQPDCNRVARFLTWVRHMRMNMA